MHDVEATALQDGQQRHDETAQPPVRTAWPPAGRGSDDADRARVAVRPACRRGSVADGRVRVERTGTLAWPAWDATHCQKDTVEIAVQVNGHGRGCVALLECSPKGCSPGGD